MKTFFKSILAGAIAYFLVFLVGCLYSNTFILSEMTAKAKHEIIIIGTIFGIMTFIAFYMEHQHRSKK